jgi:hypothetical protein
VVVPEPDKIRYEVALGDPVPIDPDSDLTVRTLARSDVRALADLMLDAYVGTIDYEGETVDEAVDEVESWFDGSPLLDHSYAIVVGGTLASAVLVMTLDASPFIAIVMTRNDRKNQRFGRYVVATALSSLKEAGEEKVVLYITSGNTPSEKLFLSLGAVPQPD